MRIQVICGIEVPTKGNEPLKVHVQANRSSPSGGWSGVHIVRLREGVEARSAPSVVLVNGSFEIHKAILLVHLVISSDLHICRFGFDDNDPT